MLTRGQPDLRLSNSKTSLGQLEQPERCVCELNSHRYPCKLPVWTGGHNVLVGNTLGWRQNNGGVRDTPDLSP